MITRNIRDCHAFAEQTVDFVKSVDRGRLTWRFKGIHSGLLTDDITVDDVQWLFQYLGKITDEQIRVGLSASGATPQETEAPRAGAAPAHRTTAGGRSRTARRPPRAGSRNDEKMKYELDEATHAPSAEARPQSSTGATTTSIVLSSNRSSCRSKSGGSVAGTADFFFDPNRKQTGYCQTEKPDV